MGRWRPDIGYLYDGGEPRPPGHPVGAQARRNRNNGARTYGDGAGHSPETEINRINAEIQRWWGRKDSNLRSHTAADLQSAPFATRDTSPSASVRNRPPEWRRTGPWMTLRPKARF